MTDRRFLASNGRVAHVSLRGAVEAERFTDGRARQLSRTAWLRRSPGGVIDRQLLVGDPFLVLEDLEDSSFGISEKDGHVGYVRSSALAARFKPTHRVSVRTTWALAAPDIKTEPGTALHMTARLTVIGEGSGWAEILTSEGNSFVPSGHLRPLDHSDDPVDAALRLLGTPYVWGGNSGFGIDCSGLVQVAFHAAGRECPPDSDLQERMDGESLSENATPERGDLLFWKGHVALVVDKGTLIHANAHHMLVVDEPIESAVARIAATEAGPVRTRLRLAL